MMATTTQPMRRTSGFPYIPMLIVALFLAPMIAAWVAFKYFPEQMRSLGANNYGQFIKPLRKIELQGLSAEDGAALESGFFDGKWTYLYIDASDCNARCKAALYEMRQVRLAQGDERDRLQRLFVLTDRSHLDQLGELMRQQFPHQSMVFADDRARTALREALKLDDGASPLSAGRIYVIDPLGRAMMYYEPVESADQSQVLEKATGMRKDMTKLLKNSKTK